LHVVAADKVAGLATIYNIKLAKSTKCSGCGKPAILNAKYYHNCGKSLLNNSRNGNANSPSQNGIARITF
jgi:hypothetical protein